MNCRADRSNFSHFQGMNELVPVNSFIRNYELVYGPLHVPFMKKTLQEAINECLFVPPELRRIIGLFFHFDGNAFSQTWCDYLISGGTIADIIEERFSILPWNLQDETTHKVLKASLKKNLGMSFNEYFEKQKSAVIFIVNISGEPLITSVLRHCISEEETLEELFFIVENFNNSLRRFQGPCLDDQRQQTLSGSRGYHQFMFEMLGDRDYDCFEEDQHEELKRKIGFAMFGPPSEEYNEKCRQQIEECYSVIRKQNNLYSKQDDKVIIAFIFNCLEPLEEEKEKKSNESAGGIQPLPIFVLKKCQYNEHMLPHSACRIFIDHEFRVYQSWNEYISEIRLQECMMVLPKDGRYQGDENDNVVLERHPSPACSIGAKVLKVADVGTAVGGIASGGIALAATVSAAAAAPAVLAGAAVTGLGVGVYSVLRSSYRLYDRIRHDQDISVTNPEARGDYINIAAGSLGTVGAGATAAVTNLTQNGVNVGRGIQYTVNTINGLNLTLGATALGNATYQIYCEWMDGQTPSAWTIAQLGASVLFFSNAVYNFRTAASIIEDTQMSVLNEYRQGLRSNNHRKMFNKLQKETIRMNNGNQQAGNAEVISTVRRIPNKDELFAVLHRNNKLFNKNGVRFSASGSEIKLNGQTIDLGHFGSLSKPEKLQMLIDLPITPSPQTPDSSSSVNIISLLNQTNILDLVVSGRPIIENCNSVSTTIYFLIGEFKQIIRQKILEILRMFIDKLNLIEFDFISFFKNEMKNVGEPIVPLLKIVLGFIRNYAESFRQEFAAARSTISWQFSSYREENPNINTFIDKVVYMFTDGGAQAARLLDELLENFLDMVAAKIISGYETTIGRSRNREICSSQKKKICCSVCCGFYFSSK